MKQTEISEINYTKIYTAEKALRETNLVRKSLPDPKGRKLAINAHCFQCFGRIKDDMPTPAGVSFIRKHL